MTETTERLRMVRSKDFRPFRYFRGTLIDGERVNHNPTEMTETTERLRMVRSNDFCSFRCYSIFNK